MNKYIEIWGWTREVFGDRSFTVDRFRAVFPSPDAAKVVHDMAKLGLIRRVKTGTYKATSPSSLARSIPVDSMSKEKILDQATDTFAYSEDDAARIWTDGYYWTGFTPGYKPVHIQVNKSDMNRWREFFRKNQAESALENDRKTLFGLTFILHPVQKVQSETRNGLPVVPLSKVIDFCVSRIGTYKPALEYLQDKFNIKTRQAQSVR